MTWSLVSDHGLSSGCHLEHSVIKNSLAVSKLWHRTYILYINGIFSHMKIIDSCPERFIIGLTNPKLISNNGHLVIFDLIDIEHIERDRESDRQVEEEKVTGKNSDRQLYNTEKRHTEPEQRAERLEVRDGDQH